MEVPISAIFISILVFISNPLEVLGNAELQTLLDIKSALDPDNQYLSSWSFNGNPCDGSFEGICCNENGQVANLTLQGKGLTGKLSPAIAGLKNLTALYLHYNSLHGDIPREISNLTQLSDLYLNVNNFSGEIPPEIGNMDSLQVLQLCYNQLTGSIPTQLGSLKKLSVVALQSNQLTGAIPASLGGLAMLMRLDLSFNHLFGSVPSRLADAPSLEVLDIRNNTLSGNLPSALKRLNLGFVYENNLGLCGVGFSSLKECVGSSRVTETRPESGKIPARDIPETANVESSCNHDRCPNSSKSQKAPIIGVVIATMALSAIGVVTFLYRRRKQKLGSSLESGSNHRLSTDQSKASYGKKGSPLVSLEYSSNGWDPLSLSGFGEEEVFQSFRFNLEEVETATHYFSEANLLGKSNFSATYKGILRDGSVVAVKSICKSSCNSEESEFLKGLNLLSSLSHENLVRLRGFCCSRGRGECFLIYDFVPNGNLLTFLDLKDAHGPVLDWSTRVSIVTGIAKGLAYLHKHESTKPSLVHQNISAEKVLIDQRFNPLLSDSGLPKLLTNDIVFSELKASAARGYLAPEYTTTGRFTEKSDVYAFGVLVFQILSGTRNITASLRAAAEAHRFQDFIDRKLHGRFFEYEAAKLCKIASLCTHESQAERPSMEAIVQELVTCTSCL